MFAKKLKCTIIRREQLSPTVFRLFFEANRRINYEPGQFISVKVGAGKRPIWRCYSFANAPADAKKNGYELCIKEVPGGKGSTHLSRLQVGESFEARAPFGHYSYKISQTDTAVFVATGTGIAPIRAILQSKKFQQNRPANIYVLTGYRSEEEILYRGELEALGAKVLCTLSQPNRFWIGLRGHVTDTLRRLPETPAWLAADYYVCGAGEMVQSVSSVLEKVLRIPTQHIIAEAFSLTPGKKQRSKQKPRLPELEPLAVNG